MSWTIGMPEPLSKTRGWFCNKCLNNSPPLILNNKNIERVNIHRHLGLYLSSSLDWSVQVKEVCLKANRKLSVLRSVKLLSRQTLDLLYKVTVRSVVDYALHVYFKTFNVTCRYWIRFEFSTDCLLNLTVIKHKLIIESSLY